MHTLRRLARVRKGHGCRFLMETVRRLWRMCMVDMQVLRSYWEKQCSVVRWLFTLTLMARCIFTMLRSDPE